MPGAGCLALILALALAGCVSGTALSGRLVERTADGRAGRALR